MNKITDNKRLASLSFYFPRNITCHFIQDGSFEILTSILGGGGRGLGRYIHAYRYSNILTYRFSIWKVISSDCLWRLEHFYHCNSVETCVKVQGCATITKYSFSDAPKKTRLEEKTTTKQTATHEILDARSKNNCNRGTVIRKAIGGLCIILLAQTFTLNSDVQHMFAYMSSTP